MEFSKLSAKISAISILKGVKNHPTLIAYKNTLSSLDISAHSFCECYSELIFKLSQKCAPETFEEAILYDENIFSYKVHENIPQEDFSHISKAVNFDLSVLKEICALCSDELLKKACLCFPDFSEVFLSLPHFIQKDFELLNSVKLQNVYKTQGFGVFAMGNAFYYEKDVPKLATSSDNITLHDLKGYKRQKHTIMQNTKSFLAGKTSNNILLYGDKGCGKSSTVKAVVNEFSDKGLKIIEIKVSEISNFAHLCSKLAKSPFKFIVFIDDLSFASEDENFQALKAFIEGGITARPDNVLIYATSNRRHMVKERFSDREGDEIQLRDALESASSLSDRFGLEITFLNPSKDEYLSIVEELSEEYGLTLPKEELFIKADGFARRKSGRSPRTARQFIYNEISKQEEN